MRGFYRHKLSKKYIPMSEIYKHRQFGSWHITNYSYYSYKPECREFDYRRCHWKFLLAQFSRPQYHPRVDLDSKTNEYQEYVLGVNVADAYCWEPGHFHQPTILKLVSLSLPKTSGAVQVCTQIALPVICFPYCLIFFNCSVELSPSFKYKQSVL